MYPYRGNNEIREPQYRVCDELTVISTGAVALSSVMRYMCKSAAAGDGFWWLLVLLHKKAPADKSLALGLIIIVEACPQLIPVSGIVLKNIGGDLLS